MPRRRRFAAALQAETAQTRQPAVGGAHGPLSGLGDAAFH
jgi:hypothetical protein